MGKKLVEYMSTMMEKEALQRAGDMLEGGEEPLEILAHCRAAMEIVGNRFETGEYFLPHLIMAGELLGQIGKMVKPKMEKEQSEQKRNGKVIIATVAGDIHDIGKDIVTFMLDVNGFEVRDLGVDIPVQTIVEEIKDFQPQVVGLSGFLTTAFDSMKNTVDAIEEAGLRDGLKVMIGGGMIDETVREYTGADAYGTDAMSAVSLTRKWVGGE